jgi:hypothetical protein
MDNEYKFRIDGHYTPETLPMARLAEYVAALARLFGETANVHFEGVSEGSAVLHAAVDQPARPKVHDRLRDLHAGIASQDVRSAFADLDELLRKDNAVGELLGDTGAVVIPFPGRSRPEPIIVGPIRQEGSLEGQVIRVGGKDETVPVHLRDGAIIHSGLNTTQEIARQIARYMFGPTLRVFGTGTWFRDGDGCWLLKSFRILRFEVLDETELKDVVKSLRSVSGSGWGDVADPVQALLEERHGRGGTT